jgi:hypothetical protein
MTTVRLRSIAAVALPVAITATAFAAGSGSASTGTAAGAQQTTELISRALDGGTPNGPSTHGVISNDKRFTRLIAYESDASDIVSGDTNGQRDVFAVFRKGPVGNNGSPWRADRTILVSKPQSGGVANGPSFSPAVDGSFHNAPKCVAFLSSASNLVAGDTNGKVDAFLSRGPGNSLSRVSLPGNRQSTADTTSVAISGDCSRVAFVTGGKLYDRVGNSTKGIKSRGTASDPSFSTGLRNDLVFAARGGIYLSSNGTSRPRRINRGGRNPVYNDIKRRTVAYEIRKGGRTQIGYHDIGKRQKIISRRGGSLGNGNSVNPVIGNSGYYVTFESSASNLSVNASGSPGDSNGRPDVYLYTDTRSLTLVQSVREKAVPLPGGGQNPSMSFYANYILFDSPAPLGSQSGPRQVFMRYLGPV